METNKTIRVILADDHPMVRRGIRRILEKVSNILVIGEADSGAAAIRLVHDLHPDVLVLDIEMPDMKGYQVAYELRQSSFRVSIVVLSACDDEHFAEETRLWGADGYLGKGETPERIRHEVYRVSKKYSMSAVWQDQP
jgi:DNA-binding NarL/FixJ family response regulator